MRGLALSVGCLSVFSLTRALAQPQWAAFGAAALRDWVAAGDAAARADAAAPAPAAPDTIAVRAAAATRRRYGAFSFAGPDAAPEAAPAALRGVSIDLSGPKARRQSACACAHATLR
jgi:hypothetical protein